MFQWRSENIGNTKTSRGGFDLSALAAGESHPLSQSSATEIGICMGDCPRRLLGQFEIFGWIATLFTGFMGKRICRSQMILE